MNVGLIIGIVIFAIALLYLLAIMPRMIRRREMPFSRHRYFAHRGLHQSNETSPENSMVAFRLAVEHGFGIELDVQLTKDGIPVVFHDYSLERVCGVKKKVNELTYEEVKRYKLYQSKETIPLFTDVLKIVNGKVPLIIELKIEATNLQLCEVVSKILDSYKGAYVIESFNPLGLIWYKKNRPNIVRGQLSSNLLKDKEPGNKRLYFLLQNLMFNFLVKPDFIAYNHIHTNMLSFLLNKKLFRIPTFAWTIRNKEELEEAKRYFDYYIFEQFVPNER